MAYRTNSSSFWGVAALMRGASIAAIATGAALVLPGTAVAQDAGQGSTQPAAGTNGTTDDGEQMVVVGFRASLQSATNTKKLAAQIVESVTAEDIGKLPDASIGESISRLPGLTSQRLNGRANVISIRGFGPDLGTTLLNGREQTSTGDSRAVEYDQYPAEIINQVVVYKSPTASLIGQGLSGTVDIRTIRPLSISHRILSIGARGSVNDLGALNAGSTDLGYRVNGTYADKFANDTIGVSLGVSYVDEAYQNQLFNAWGYAGAGTAASPTVIGGNRSFVQSTQLKRFGAVGTVQWRPQPELTFTVDGFYSHFIDDQINRGIELPLGFGGGFNVQPVTNTTVQNGFVTSGTFNNVRGVVRNDPFERRADQYSFGFNSAWEGRDGWKASFDFGYSRTDRNELSIESYSGTGFNGDDAVLPAFPLGTSQADSISFTSGRNGTSFRPTLNYSDPNLIRLTDPLGWGGATVPQVGYYNNRIVNDELQQYRVKVDREIADNFISAVHFGAGYTYRTKSLTPDEALIRLAGGATELTIPSQYLLRPTNLGYLGLGPIVSYDPRALIAAGNIYTLVPNEVPDVLQKAYTLKEKLLQTFLQADINQDFGAARLTGNFGVQAVITNQSSSGVVFLSATERTPTRLGADYVDVLPSINLALEFPGNWIIRLAAAREIQRPRPDDMRVAIGYGYNQAQQVISGSGGNPTLRPFRANAVDLNFEKYWGRGSYFSFQLFYKDVDTFIFPGVFAFDFGIFPPPTNFPGGSTVGPITAPINTKGGEIYGAEISTTALFGTIVPALDGFGFTGGAGYTYSNITNDRGQRQTIPGYSKWTASGTLFFEKWGFNLRGSARYRSGFLGDFSGFGGNLTRRNALSETIIDAQAGYDFGRVGPLAGVSIFVQAQNLTDEPFRSVATPTAPLQVIDYQTFGRRIFFGATLKY